MTKIIPLHTVYTLKKNSRLKALAFQLFSKLFLGIPQWFVLIVILVSTVIGMAAVLIIEIIKTIVTLTATIFKKLRAEWFACGNDKHSPNPRL